MRKSFYVFSAAIVMSSIALNALCREPTDRTGIFMGIGPTAGGEVHDIERVAGGARFRIGAGLKEDLLVYLDNAVFATKKNGNFYDVYNGQAKIQFFLLNDLYVNAGAGLGVGSVIDSPGNDSSTTTKVGFSIGGGIGYEFHPTEHFVIAPELTLDYDRIKNSDYVIPAGFLYLGWYL